MSNRPEEPADFGSPDFLRNPEPPSEGEPLGMETGPLFGEESVGPPLEEGTGESTASVEIPMESSTPSMEISDSESAPSLEIHEEKPETETEEEEPSEPTFWERLVAQLDTYTVILLVSLLAITVAVVLLGLELGAYQWDIGAKATGG